MPKNIFKSLLHIWEYILEACNVQDAFRLNPQELIWAASKSH